MSTGPVSAACDVRFHELCAAADACACSCHLPPAMRRGRSRTSIATDAAIKRLDADEVAEVAGRAAEAGLIEPTDVSVFRAAYARFVASFSVKSGFISGARFDELYEELSA